MRKYFYLCLVLVMFFSIDSVAQMNRKSIKKNNRRISSFKGKKNHFSSEKRYSAIGVSLNALNYYGDLAPRPNRFSTDLAFTRPAIGLSYTHRFGPFYSLSANFLYGGIRGADAESAEQGDLANGVYRYQRNLSFRNRIKELAILANFDLFQNQATYISRVKWTPFAYIGLAVFHHNPQAQVPTTDVQGNPLPNAGEWVNLRPLGTEGQFASLEPTDVNFGLEPYKLIQLAIPFGIGARFRINEVMDFSAEVGVRYAFTDYLDDVSNNYVDLGVFGNNEVAKALSYRSHELNNFQPSPVNPNLREYTGRDGQTYYVIPGYGEEYSNEVSSNVRGNANDKDIYTTITFRLTYIIGKTFHRAKFR